MDGTTTIRRAIAYPNTTTTECVVVPCCGVLNGIATTARNGRGVRTCVGFFCTDFALSASLPLDGGTGPSYSSTGSDVVAGRGGRRLDEEPLWTVMSHVVSDEARSRHQQQRQQRHAGLVFVESRIGTSSSGPNSAGMPAVLRSPPCRSSYM